MQEQDEDVVYCKGLNLRLQSHFELQTFETNEYSIDENIDSLSELIRVIVIGRSIEAKT